MTESSTLIKIGRQGILAGKARIPASYFRHQQPGKCFVVLDEGDRRLMHVRSADLGAIRQAYSEYAVELKNRKRSTTEN
jgi:hypothetical protein